MTDFELSQAEKQLIEQMQKTCEESGGPTPEQKRQYEKFMCLRMINSIIAYHWYEGQTAKRLLDWELNDRHHSYLKKYVNKFGYDEVLALVQDQLEDIESIERNVFTDGEGVTYNSIIWKEKEVK